MKLRNFLVLLENPKFQGKMVEKGTKKMNHILENNKTFLKNRVIERFFARFVAQKNMTWRQKKSWYI